jgi:N-acetylglucosaminyl-diphospho-decaprenol L-rhamnosyltransferase
VDAVRLSAVIPTFNSGGFLDRCLDALEDIEVVEEVLVLDGGSVDGSAERAATRKGVRVLSRPGTSLQFRLNYGMKGASNDFVLLLNDDAFVDPDTPERLLESMRERPRLAASGAKLRYEDGRPQRSVGPYRTLLGELFILFSLKRLSKRFSGGTVPRQRDTGVDEAPWLPLCCALLRRSAFRAVGWYDEHFSFYYDDHDICRRLNEDGWSLAVRWDAGAVHVGGGATKSKNPAKWFGRYHENRIIYLRKHYPRGWRVFALLWPGRALLHMTLWRLRALRHRARRELDEERTALEWVQAFKGTIRGAPRGPQS